ncbi:flagellin [Chromobacterium sp. IIBBL 290-4]|uniref:flagellin N-terminal helical domain-containing protein n=1 Tax=Chromobacterium sp. IIBBL 290-4 TaxID=2953890 RepID=UPI0020B7E9EA|nr:flagellin [Chromobacterium sp. IIBBL 290-4]UTH73070.1 flagellin [Chromobacterium sp. IIBBL 290-4]
MLSLHTNIAALNTKSNMNSTQGALSTSMTRLGTGLRINSAMDDAAGLQIATRLDAQSRGMTVAMKNAQNGISMLQTAEGALNEVTNILQRMKDLGTEGANATATDADKKAMQSEFDQLGKELTNIMKNTSFGGEKLLQGGKLTKAISFQIGAASTESMGVDLSGDLGVLDTALGNVSKKYEKDVSTPSGPAPAASDADKVAAKKLAVDAAAAELKLDPTTAAKQTALTTAITAMTDITKTSTNKDVKDATDAVTAASTAWTAAVAGTDPAATAKAKDALDRSVAAYASVVAAGSSDEIGKSSTIDTISKALDAVGTVRSSLGANANRLDHVINNLSNINNNTLAAKGRVMDTDYANESANMTAKQMLMQASTSMLKQSGSMNSLAMSLLQ